MAHTFLTTHVGSLPRTDALIEAFRAFEEGSMSFGDMRGLLRDSVDEVVGRQAAIGIGIPGDGEYGHGMSSATNYGSWWTYIFDRVSNLELREVDFFNQPDVISEPGNIRLTGFIHRRDRKLFPRVYAEDVTVTTGRPRPFPAVTGKMEYIGQEFVSADTENLNAALEKHGYGRGNGFITALAPGSAIRLTDLYNEDEEASLWAWAEVLREEYRAIIDAGLILQFDDPGFAESWDQINPEPSVADYVKFTQRNVEALNWAIRDLPRDRLRFHLCHGSWHGPHATDLGLEHLVDLLLTVNVGGYSFEAANVRHEHEYRIWDTVKLPEDRVIIPGVISHATNIIEHPELVAERIGRFASRVGPERVIASSDCGLGGRIHPDLAWAKLESLVAGAEIAGRRF